MTDGHEVQPNRLSDPTQALLEALETTSNTTQRSLARRIGIALGLTNLLLRRFIAKGWVRVTHVKAHRVGYLLTPAGLAEKARLSQQALQNSVDRYRLVRLRILKALHELSRNWPGDAADGRRRIIFLGSGEVAEIGFICLQETEVELVAVIDDQGRERFFGVPVLRMEHWPHQWPENVLDAQVVVMSLVPSDQINQQLAALGHLGARAVWI